MAMHGMAQRLHSQLEALGSLAVASVRQNRLLEAPLLLVRKRINKKNVTMGANR